MYEITICMCNSLHTAYIQCCTMLVVQHDVLNSLHTMLYYASVQESAALYMQDSYRSVLPKNGSGRWSAFKFLWHFFKNVYIRVCQLLYMVNPCTVTSVHENGKMPQES